MENLFKILSAWLAIGLLIVTFIILVVVLAHAIKTRRMKTVKLSLTIWGGRSRCVDLAMIGGVDEMLTALVCSWIDLLSDPQREKWLALILEQASLPPPHHSLINDLWGRLGGNSVLRVAIFKRLSSAAQKVSLKYLTVDELEQANCLDLLATYVGSQQKKKLPSPAAVQSGVSSPSILHPD